MSTFVLILNVAAFLLFLFAGINISPGRVNLIGLGLACAWLAILLGSGVLSN